MAKRYSNSRNPRQGEGRYNPSDANNSARRSVRSSSRRPSTNGRPVNGDASSYSRYNRAEYGQGGASDPGASRFDRRISQAQYAKVAKSRKRKKIALIALASVLIMALVGVGVAFALYKGVADNFQEGIDQELRDTLVKTDIAKEPFYMVLMGTDGSADREASEEFAGDQFRTDSLMLARIDPVAKTVAIVSIPRDTKVEIEGYGTNKINAAHALGGAALTVKTVSEFAGVPISHYAEINFDGFKGVVDTLGGIEVDVPIEIDDDDAGGYLAPGVQTLNGEQALILCRSRHAFDEYGPGDLYRAANQRLVLTAIAKKILASDIGTMTSTVTTLSEYVTTDLTPADIMTLALAFQGVDASQCIYTAAVPTTSKMIDELSYEVAVEPDWTNMMKRIDQGLPPTEEDEVDELSGTILATTGSSTPPPSGSAAAKKTGTVSVKNGSGVTGVAISAGDKVSAMGYTVDTGNADAFTYTTTLVIYNTADQAADAQAIVDALGVGMALLNDGSYLFESDYLVVVGADWA